MVHLNGPTNKKIDYLRYNKMMKFYDYHAKKSSRGIEILLV
jgi:hypothetical protein